MAREKAKLVCDFPHPAQEAPNLGLPFFGIGGRLQVEGIAPNALFGSVTLEALADVPARWVNTLRLSSKRRHGQRIYFRDRCAPVACLVLSCGKSAGSKVNLQGLCAQISPA